MIKKFLNLKMELFFKISIKFWYFLKIWSNFLFHFFLNILFELIYDKHLKNAFFQESKKIFMFKKNFKQKMDNQDSIFNLNFNSKRNIIKKKNKIRDSLRKLIIFENKEKTRKLNFFLGFLKLKNRNIRNFEKFKKLIEIFIEFKFSLDTLEGFFLFFFDSISFFCNVEFSLFIPFKFLKKLLLFNLQTKKKIFIEDKKNAVKIRKKFIKIRNVCIMYMMKH